MNDTQWTSKDEALSHNAAARVDAMRFFSFSSDTSELTDDELKRRFDMFQGHITTIHSLIDDMPDDGIGSLLVKTIQLIETTHIAPLESEMARRWRSE